jgi:hypothetical protein
LPKGHDCYAGGQAPILPRRGNQFSGLQTQRIGKFRQFHVLKQLGDPAVPEVLPHGCRQFQLQGRALAQDSGLAPHDALHDRLQRGVLRRCARQAREVSLRQFAHAGCPILGQPFQERLVGGAKSRAQSLQQLETQVRSLVRPHHLDQRAGGIGILTPAILDVALTAGGRCLVPVAIVEQLHIEIAALFFAAFVPVRPGAYVRPQPFGVCPQETVQAGKIEGMRLNAVPFERQRHPESEIVLRGNGGLAVAEETHQHRP